MSRLQGLGALLRDKKRIARHLAILGLIAGTTLGLFFRLAGSVGDFSSFVMYVFAATVAFIAPLGAGGSDTFSGYQAGARSRREELLTLPVGRLALPSAILLGGLAMALVTIATFTIGLSFLLGWGPTLDGWTCPWPGGPDMLARIAGGIAIFCLGFSFGSIGAHPVNATLFWAAVPFLVGPLAFVMGHDTKDLESYGFLAGGSLALYFLVLPFTLYAGPIHRWSPVKRGGIDPDGVALLASMLLVTVFGIFGAGRVFVCVLAACAGLACWSARGRPRHERRSMPLVRIAWLLALVAVAPAIVVGAVYDARRVASAGAPAGKPIRRFEISPDGRWLAVSVQPADMRREGSVERVVVTDLSGRAAPIVLPPRCAELPAGAWSADGRYLAVRDVTAGRLRYPESELERHDAGLFARSLMHALFVETVILDTQTGRIVTVGDRLVRPGWRTPAELVNVAITFGHSRILTDGRGRRAVLDRSFLDLFYDDGLVLEHAGGERRRLDAGGLAPVPVKVHWSVVDRTEHNETGSELASITLDLARGSEHVRVEAVAEEDWIGNDAMLVRTRRGLEWVSLPSLESRVLAPADCSVHHTGDHVVIETADASFALETATGALTRIALEPGFTALAVRGGRILMRRPDGELFVKEGEAPARPVFGP
jgi:hypothetical protein